MVIQPIVHKLADLRSCWVFSYPFRHGCESARRFTGSFCEALGAWDISPVILLCGFLPGVNSNLLGHIQFDFRKGKVLRSLYATLFLSIKWMQSIQNKLQRHKYLIFSYIVTCDMIDVLLFSCPPGGSRGSQSRPAANLYL